MNGGLTLHTGVPGAIFIVYGVVSLFTGVLYVVPPLSFCRRVGGEVLLAEGLGLMPVLGAYLIQVGDLTRSVYLASLPIVVATGLWVWTDELVSRVDDERTGRKTMVMIFPERFSGRYVTLMIAIMLYGTLLAAVLVQSSLAPLSLVALVTVGAGLKIVSLSWNGYADAVKMAKARKYAFLIHLVVCVAIALSSGELAGLIF
jgi:1,4-dihydroxy-2-naphthoate octaprenyltransferase